MPFRLFLCHLASVVYLLTRKLFFDSLNPNVDFGLQATPPIPRISTYLQLSSAESVSKVSTNSTSLESNVSGNFFWNQSMLVLPDVGRIDSLVDAPRCDISQCPLKKSIIFHTFWHSVSAFRDEDILSLKSFWLTNGQSNGKSLSNRPIVLWTTDKREGVVNESETLENEKEQNALKEVRKYAVIKNLDERQLEATYLDAISRDSRSRALVNLRRYRTRYLSRKANLYRLLLLYQFGGVWFDIDIVSLRNFDPLFHRFPKDFAAYSWERSGYPNNAFMFSVLPRNPRVHYVLEYMATRRKGYGFQTSELTYDHKVPLTVLPCSWFDTDWVMGKFEERWARFWRPGSLNVTTFYRGAFTYHWHNRASCGKAGLCNISAGGSLVKSLEKIFL